MQPKVKILVAYHKPAVLLKDDILTPIHLGRALSTEASKDGKISQNDLEWLINNTIGDDTGDNISHLNRYYNELTGFYWAWKNYDKLGNPDYIGFMSYRCHFIFDDTDNIAYYNYSTYANYQPDLDYKNKLFDLLNKHDGILNNPVCLPCTIEEQYKNEESIKCGHISQDYDLLRKIIAEEFPTYLESFEQISKQNSIHFSNMFIMPKEMFFKYCEFIFPINKRLHELTDFTNRTLMQQRNYLSERLFNLFLAQYDFSNYAKIPVSVLHNTDILDKVKPAFNNNNIPIIFSFDKNYLDYGIVALYSLIKHSNSSMNYDISILHTDIDKISIDKTISIIEDRTNISIRFFNISSFIGSVKNKYQSNIFFLSNHLSLATYYRFWIPEIFCDYDKILYLDCDIVIRNDVAKLYHINLDGKTLAGAKDIGIQCAIKAGNTYFESYCHNKLNMLNTDNYMQAGVIIYDIKKCIQKNFTELCLNKLVELEKPLLHDQDVLNACFYGDIKFLPLEWNYTWHVAIDFANYANYLPVNTANEYLQAGKIPSIIHYCSHLKPWISPHLPKADIWWKYARNTPFYEEILFANIFNNINKSINSNGPVLITKPVGAVKIVKSHLSYKIGSALIQAKNPLKAIFLPFTLILIIAKHKLLGYIFKNLSDHGIGLNSKHIYDYIDYQDALKYKKHLSYRLGNLLIHHPFTFIFKVKKEYKRWKKGR